MGDRTPFVVGMLAIVGVVAWLFVRGEDAHEREPSPTPIVAAPAPAPASRAAPAPRAAPARPALPATPATATTPSAADAFVAEPRDEAWARATEAALGQRWKQIRGGTLASTECRKSECRLIVTGTQDSLAQAIADLEGPRGLHGFAENVLLSSPTVATDGTVTLHIYARFTR